MHFYTTFLIFLLCPAASLKGLKSVIAAQHDVAVKVGDEARLQCPLRYSEEVLQVMWQKVLPEEEEVTVATCHSLRHRLNPDFDGKISLKETRPQNCSMVVTNVTEHDEGCYLCLFITSTDVAFTGKTCLQVYELHDPNLTVSESSSPGEMVVSCSATGRPAPNVTLHVQETGLTHNNTVSVINSNGTVTVITTAVLSHSHWDTVCMCAVRSPYVSERQVFTTVPGVAKDVVPNAHIYRIIVALIIVLVCVCVAIATTTAVLHVKKQKIRNVGIEANHGTTPLRGSEKQENESVRKRTPQSDQEGGNSKLPPRPQSAKRLEM